MSIHIYNSLTRKKEEFIPLNPPQVNIYTCGVTVYDESHIGHARSLYIFDVIRRYLKYKNFKVNFVRNITDIEDKIINRARELNLNWNELVEKYIKSYKEDLALLGIKEGILDGKEEPRATRNIEEIKGFIQDLIDKGFAYVTKSGVYFSVRKFKDYGKLSGQSIDQMLTGVRKEPDETKADPLDFALWKISKVDEPFWESPWGKGRPGWHIECSVMSQKYLKINTLDIHAGGRDLIFPHHENEIAQSEAKSGKPFAKYWLHHGLLTINGQKMSKSLGNFITIKDFINKYKDADLLKLFFLSAHYSSPIDYSDKEIDEAKKKMERISILVGTIQEKLKVLRYQPGVEENIQIKYMREEFINAMDDDFNTPKALAVIFELVNRTNKNIDDLDFIYNAQKTLNELLKILGISLENMLARYSSVEKEIAALISEREKARKEKNYALSDEIRKELEEKGIILEDAKGGKTIWRKKI